MVIIAAAAKAAADAGWTASIFGPLGIIAASSIAFGLVSALVSKLPKLAGGGEITGGTPGVDSVHTVLQRGEGVLMPGQTALLKRLADNLERGGWHGSGVVINMASVVPASGADAARAARTIRRLNKRGARSA
jgi:hypothetical protein